MGWNAERPTHWKAIRTTIIGRNLALPCIKQWNTIKQLLKHSPIRTLLLQRLGKKRLDSLLIWRIIRARPPQRHNVRRFLMKQSVPERFPLNKSGKGRLCHMMNSFTVRNKYYKLQFQCKLPSNKKNNRINKLY